MLFVCGCSLGTLFLWTFWPSFNSVLVQKEEEKQAAIYNTYFAMATSAVAAFAFSKATSSDGTFHMVSQKFLFSNFQSRGTFS